jgi:hypothetical protein
MDDKIWHGTNGQKLTNKQVQAIRRDRRHRETIAAEFHITPNTVQNIRCGNRWKSLPWPASARPWSIEDLRLAASQVKLTPAQVHAIRADRRMLKTIAGEYGLDQSTVSLIRNGKRWMWLPWKHPTPLEIGERLPPRHRERLSEVSMEVCAMA